MSVTEHTVHAGMGGEVSVYVANRIGFIELNRPGALNALTPAMIRTMHAALEQWRSDPEVLALVVRSQHARAFCAGGDIRLMYEAHQRGDVDAIEQFFIAEYRLNHAIFTYPKPYLALMQGVVMGGGMGIALGAAQTGGVRVVTSSTRMAMPETRIGLFPDVGASWFLARTPGAIGRYLAVTGETIDGASAITAGLADLWLDDAGLPGLLEGLTREPFERAQDVVRYVRRVAGTAAAAAGSAAATASLAVIRPALEHHFGQPDVAQIFTSLAAPGEPAWAAWAEWAQQTAAAMRERSPLSMAVSLEAVTRARSSSMAQCLRRDLDLTRSTFAQGEVIEGIRARIIDKDQRPHWRFASIEAVPQQVVAQMFESPWLAADHPLRDLSD
ncbi:enoyl-CoA hydratase/isomerase family protein [Paraburkholderia bonniea]|uniref:enoyl-CoA hydratase/isomerase family protein n=1 Tax=Paraburkholderia bonniea TaxID=2152891 RepID=UPI0025727883|nr:enoyl-CoA hydratase/isomerase family protein [Paraburkholderia bonniea]WJF88927.1 enoyl-CoA hydratase/isomerase family protein [Paraburkholderia bonniea]WJF92243.1 enoyl-CoA hydratase/isomerase family protein [Paraburkholderia bonniea]